jgi:threonine/homoserine/homoserine lactone efflux protein
MKDSTRRTLRTILQVALGVAITLPVLVQAAGLDAEQLPWLAAIVVGAAVFARVMQSPAVEGLLQRILGGALAAAPAPAVVPGDVVDEHDDPDGELA